LIHFFLKNAQGFALGCLTAGVTRKWAGVDSAWEREKLEATQKAKKRADSHLSGARIVGRVCVVLLSKNLLNGFSF
jgi:hypothetical protein